MSQFLKCQFNPWDRRSYTYQNDSDALAVGDRVIVMTDRGETEVTVVEICAEKPDFQCKPIIRKVEAEQTEGEES